jgi:hypothetical protein
MIRWHDSLVSDNSCASGQTGLILGTDPINSTMPDIRPYHP